MLRKPLNCNWGICLRKHFPLLGKSLPVITIFLMLKRVPLGKVVRLGCGRDKRIWLVGFLGPETGVARLYPLKDLAVLSSWWTSSTWRDRVGMSLTHKLKRTGEMISPSVTQACIRQWFGVADWKHMSNLLEWRCLFSVQMHWYAIHKFLIITRWRSKESQKGHSHSNCGFTDHHISCLFRSFFCTDPHGPVLLTGKIRPIK